MPITWHLAEYVLLNDRMVDQWIESHQLRIVNASPEREWWRWFNNEGVNISRMSNGCLLFGPWAQFETKPERMMPSFDMEAESLLSKIMSGDWVTRPQCNWDNPSESNAGAFRLAPQRCRPKTTTQNWNSTRLECDWGNPCPFRCTPKIIIIDFSLVVLPLVQLGIHGKHQWDIPNEGTHSHSRRLDVECNQTYRNVFFKSAQPIWWKSQTEICTKNFQIVLCFWKFVIHTLWNLIFTPAHSRIDFIFSFRACAFSMSFTVHSVQSVEKHKLKTKQKRFACFLLQFFFIFFPKSGFILQFGSTLNSSASYLSRLIFWLWLNWNSNSDLNLSRTRNEIFLAWDSLNDWTHRVKTTASRPTTIVIRCVSVRCVWMALWVCVVQICIHFSFTCSTHSNVGWCCRIRWLHSTDSPFQIELATWSFIHRLLIIVFGMFTSFDGGFGQKFFPEVEFGAFSTETAFRWDKLAWRPICLRVFSWKPRIVPMSEWNSCPIY